MLWMKKQESTVQLSARLFDVIYDQSAEIFSLICPLWCVSLYLVHTYLSMCVGFFCKEEQENRVKLLDRQPKGPFCLRHVDGRCRRLLYVNLAQQLISIDDSLSPTPSQFLNVCGPLRPCIIDYHFHLIVNRWHGILGRGFQFGRYYTSSIILSILCI